MKPPRIFTLCHHTLSSSHAPGEYRENTGREFPEDFKDGVEPVSLSSGQDAYFINTRFYREAKGLNQSRFDLVVFSEKENAGYLYTVSVQYKDDDYSFESEKSLRDFAAILFSYFTLKN